MYGCLSRDHLLEGSLSGLRVSFQMTIEGENYGCELLCPFSDHSASTTPRIGFPFLTHRPRSCVTVARSSASQVGFTERQLRRLLYKQKGRSAGQSLNSGIAASVTYTALRCYTIQKPLELVSSCTVLAQEGDKKHFGYCALTARGFRVICYPLKRIISGQYATLFQQNSVHKLCTSGSHDLECVIDPMVGSWSEFHEN